MPFSSIPSCQFEFPLLQRRKTHYQCPPWHMKTHHAPFILALCLIGCTNTRKQNSPPQGLGGGCAHYQELPALKLDAVDRQLLANRSDSPKSAADYYFKLPAAYFSIIENSPERRASFVERDSLTDRYLHAEHWFECDGGGFEVTIRLFDTDDGPLVAILSSTYDSDVLLKEEHPRPGELEAITVNRPRFWRYRDGRWIRVDDSILPGIGKEFVLDRYHNHYKAHLKNADQQKFIWLTYDLPATGRTIPVTGRENFMDPFETYTWTAFSFDGKRFLPVSD